MRSCRSRPRLGSLVAPSAAPCIRAGADSARRARNVSLQSTLVRAVRRRDLSRALLIPIKGNGGFMVTLTDKASEKVKELMNGSASEQGLRVAVRGGSCAGFQYALAFDQQRDDDQIYEYSDIRLLIDSESLPFVDGSEVDYVEGLQGAGFAVNNPNVVAACGCGQSFRTAS